jgi:septum formation protein
MSGFWTRDRPLVLASGSQARRALLAAALVPLVVVPATIDERAVEAPLRGAGASPASIAASLAAAKALDVSLRWPGDLVLGADQTLALGPRMFTKAANLAEARRALETLSGQTHSLHSAWALALDGQILDTGLAEARLTMRRLGEDFLDRYVAEEGLALCESVGAYRLEGAGIHLFETVEGDHSTILGLPLLPVLAALRTQGSLLG